MNTEHLNLKELAEVADKTAPGGWYMAGQPWLPPDVETYVLAGSPDPHAGEMVCDMPTADMAGVEDKYDEDEWRVRNDALAAYIAAAHPQAILALLQSLSDITKERDEALATIDALSAPVTRAKDEYSSDEPEGWLKRHLTQKPPAEEK